MTTTNGAKGPSKAAIRRRKPKTERKTYEVRFRVSEVDVDRLTRISRKLEVTPSEILRRLIREEAEEHGVA